MNNLNWTDLIRVTAGLDKEAAASEAKKNALQKKYSLSAEDVNLAAMTDPTPNGEYTEWLCRGMSRDEVPRYDISATPDETVISFLTTFTRLKQSPLFQEACKEGKFSSDIMKLDWGGLFRTCRDAKQLFSKNQSEQITMNLFKEWTGEYEGHKVEVYSFSPDDLGSGGAEAYALTSSGSSVGRDLETKKSETNWCTVDSGAAEEYLEGGDAYIIRVDGRNYCNIHESSSQCRDAENHTMVNNNLISDPIVAYCVEKTPIRLLRFRLGSNSCHQCQGGGLMMEDSRPGLEGRPLCMECFQRDWISDIKGGIRTLYNQNPNSFVEEPTTTNMNKWIKALWDEDGKEHERNFWNPEDIEQVMKQLGFMTPELKKASLERQPQTYAQTVVGHWAHRAVGRSLSGKLAYAEFHAKELEVGDYFSTPEAPEAPMKVLTRTMNMGYVDLTVLLPNGKERPYRFSPSKTLYLGRHFGD